MLAFVVDVRHLLSGRGVVGVISLVKHSGAKFGLSFLVSMDLSLIFGLGEVGRGVPISVGRAGDSWLILITVDSLLSQVFVFVSEHLGLQLVCLP